MFKKDDYIVCLEGVFGNSLNPSVIARKNYCVKQFEDSTHLYIYKAIDDDKISKSNSSYTYGKSRALHDWRYATPEEAEEYERLGYPYDVTTLDKFKVPEKWCVKDTADDKSIELYEYASIHGAIPPYGANKYSYKVYYHFPPSEGCTTSDDIIEGYTEITYNQFLKYVLKQNEVKEDYSSILNLLTKYGIT